MALQGSVAEVWDDIRKPKYDNRLYRGLALSNGMKVFLTSDQTSAKSAVALRVNIGYNCDPDDKEGLAHICQHMVLTGLLYENFNKILSNHGGKSNASTYFDYTLYYFEVNSDKLYDALYYFSQLFTKRSFKRNMKNQLRNIKQEHSSNMMNDAWRLDQIGKSLMKQDHPLRKSNLYWTKKGKTEPDNKCIKKNMQEFFDKHYSASVMSLCIRSKDNLNDLQDVVKELFCNVQNSKVDIEIYDQDPFDSEHYKIKIIYKPLKETFGVMLRFPLFINESVDYPEIENYFSCLLASQDGNTLLSKLKSKGWCNSLVCGTRSIANNIISFFNIAVDLNEENYDNIDDIITSIFQYIALLRETGPIEKVFEQIQNIVDMNSYYADESSPLSFVISKVREMQIRPMNELLYISRRKLTYADWGKNIITEIMNCLLPENVMIYIIAGHTIHHTSPEDQIDLKKNYGIEDIPQEIIGEWKKSSADMELPKFTLLKFMAKNFIINPTPDVIKNLSRADVVV